MGVRSPSDVVAWAKACGQAPGRGEWLAVTFVVDCEGLLLIADRHSEHVACAAGGDVRSAGEMLFAFEDPGAGAVAVSNQSTGYCPEPESWPAVAAALDRCGIGHPGGFTTECVFRRCEGCGERNLVKDGWFVCDVCGARLPAKWNFALAGSDETEPHG